MLRIGAIEARHELAQALRGRRRVTARELEARAQIAGVRIARRGALEGRELRAGGVGLARVEQALRQVQAQRRRRREARDGVAERLDHAFALSPLRLERGEQQRCARRSGLRRERAQVGFGLGEATELEPGLRADRADTGRRRLARGRALRLGERLLGAAGFEQPAHAQRERDRVAGLRLDQRRQPRERRLAIALRRFDARREQLELARLGRRARGGLRVRDRWLASA